MNRGWRFCRPLPYHLATAPNRPAGLKTCATTAGKTERRVDRTRLTCRSIISTRSGVGVVAPRSGACRAGEGPPRAILERETGFEPATSTLARSHSTTELFPLAPNGYRTTRSGSPSSEVGGRRSRCLIRFCSATHRLLARDDDRRGARCTRRRDSTRLEVLRRGSSAPSVRHHMRIFLATHVTARSDRAPAVIPNDELWNWTANKRP